MKFMLTWSIKTENRHVVFERFANADLSQEMPQGVKLIGRWHSIGDFTGCCIIEAENEASIFQWLLLWNDLVDVNYKPVVEDEEAQKIGKDWLASKP